MIRRNIGIIAAANYEDEITRKAMRMQMQMPYSNDEITATKK